jgi:regulator of protease activity HflC (stomatin/prohibitin superfamily)
LIDLREHVVSFAPQPVVTENNPGGQIDTVVYFRATDPGPVSYEVANPV